MNVLNDRHLCSHETPRLRRRLSLITTSILYRNIGSDTWISYTPLSTLNFVRQIKSNSDSPYSIPTGTSQSLGTLP